MANGVQLHSRDERPLVFKSIPFVLVHLAPIGLWWTGFHLREAVLCFALYYARMFFIAAGFHRYFAHRAYKMGRVMPFVMAWGGSTACQKGGLWWAAHHRSHHRYSDTDRDIHSPKRGFWWSHVGWILCPKYQATDWPTSKTFRSIPSSSGSIATTWCRASLWARPVTYSAGGARSLPSFYPRLCFTTAPSPSSR